MTPTPFPQEPRNPGVRVDETAWAVHRVPEPPPTDAPRRVGRGVRFFV